MPTLDRLTCTLHYDDLGSAEDGLVFLHGWCDDASNWSALLPHFQDRFRCLVPEMRGHGRSTMPTDHAFFPEALSGDVVALCETAGIERPILIGHSFGGFLAAEVVRRFPGFVRGVVIIDQVLDLVPLGQQMKQIEAVVRNRETHLSFREQYMRSLFAADTPEAVIEAAMAVEMRTPAEVGMALWAPLFEFTPDELKRRSGELISAVGFLPALSIDREEQPDYYRELEAGAPSVHIEVVRGGHWLQLEHPDRLAVLIDEFFERYGLG